MSTVVTPHACSQSAMAIRSQELAPNRRTWAGKPLAALGVEGPTLGAGTQTMCMSECTSMPAALGWRMVRAGAGWRGGRAGWAVAEECLLRLMVSATFREW